MDRSKEKIFHYDAKTGLYLKEGLADPSPLEPGLFLIPANATTEPPPDEVPAGFAPFYRRGVWGVEEVPEADADLDGQQDAPQGFAADQQKPGFFRRLMAVVGL